jgi:hypothetical protein
MGRRNLGDACAHMHARGTVSLMGLQVNRGGQRAGMGKAGLCGMRQRLHQRVGLQGKRLG